MIQYSTMGNVNGSFPNYTGKNASGAGAIDGTPYIASFIDDIWGRIQAIMDRAGLTPDGVTESVTNSQHIEALKKGFATGAGYIKPYCKAGTPLANGDRLLLLTGQGVLRANYTELDAAVYVGDGNNSAVQAAGGKFYRATDAAGTMPSITGVYLILPDLRGSVLRGLDIAASIDPDGASRKLGDFQRSAMWGHQHGYKFGSGTDVADSGIGFTGNSTGGLSTALDKLVRNPTPDGVNGTPITSSESRGANVSINFGITY